MNIHQKFVDLNVIDFENRLSQLFKRTDNFKGESNIRGRLDSKNKSFTFSYNDTHDEYTENAPTIHATYIAINHGVTLFINVRTNMLFQILFSSIAACLAIYFALIYLLIAILIYISIIILTNHYRAKWMIEILVDRIKKE